MRNWFFFSLLALFAPLCLSAEGIPYAVEFDGLKNRDILRDIKSVAQLTTVKKSPLSLSALRYRADADVPHMLKILRAYGYYEAKVDIYVEEGFPKARVIVYISSGPLYRIANYSLKIYTESKEQEMLVQKLDLTSIGISPGMPALSQKIKQSESLILKVLSDWGYPLAELQGNEIIVDGNTHTLNIKVNVRTGPLCSFGPLTITGAHRVKEDWIRNKIAWKEGARYDNRLIQETQKKIIETSLFSSVLVLHGNEPDEHGQLPMQLEMGETLHKNVNAGISYQTQFGIGVTFGWENRNVGGEGKILSLQGDIAQDSHSGVLTYRIPEFRRKGQDLATQLQAMHEEIEHVYSERNYSLTSRLERRINPRLRFSIGGRVERMYVTGSLQNGKFLIAQMPLFVGWASVNNILNPTQGMSVEYTLSPSMNFDKIGRWYLEQKISHGSYLPVSKKSDLLVFAQRITLGSILSQRLKDIPIPERFLGGSEDDLRGYSYLTVSPLRRSANGNLQALGGRSAIFYTFETRFRLSESIGLVPFFDLGNVWLNPLPTLEGKWYKSVGLGLRYFTFIGPLRCDIGFPLERRSGIDHRWRILVSIGQSF